MERARADYVRSELRKLGLTDIRTDEMLNVSGVRKGTGEGPSVVFAAHLDTVFPAGTELKVRRDGNLLRAPGIGDDTGNVAAHPLVTTAVDAANFFREPGSAPVVPLDIGSTDANFAVSLGIPAIATGTLISGNDHQLDEYAVSSSIVPGIKQLISLALP